MFHKAKNHLLDAEGKDGRLTPFNSLDCVELNTFCFGGQGKVKVGYGHLSEAYVLGEGGFEKAPPWRKQSTVLLGPDARVLC